MNTGKTPFHKTLLSTAISLIVISQASQVAATTISDAQTSRQNLTQNEDLDITSTGSVTVSNATDSVAIDGGEGYNGTITNDGTVSSSSSSTSSTTAYGVYFNNGGSLTNDITGSLTNNGTISASNTGSNNQILSSYAIYAQYQDLNGGSLINNGSLEASTNNDANSFAYGIYASDLEDADLINSGDINVSSISSAGQAYARGIYLSGSIDAQSSFIPGNITLSTEGYTHADAEVINIGDSYIDLDLEGTIIATAESSNGNANVDIFYQEYLMTTQTQNGSVTASANGSTGAEINGFEFGSGTESTGSFINNGNITLNTSTSTGDSEIDVFFSSSYMDGSIINNGNIDAHAFGGNAVVTYLHPNNTDSESLISNTGSINLSATSYTDEASAVFIYADETLAGGTSILNSGEINISSTSDTNQVSSFFIQSQNDMNADISNSGTIYLKTSAQDDANAYLYLIDQEDGEVYGSVSNSGTITQTASSEDGTITNIGMNLSVADDFDFSNSGTYSLLSNSENSQINNYLIYTEDSFNGSINNTGTINLTANSTSDRNYNYGFYFDGDFNGTLNHSGTTNIVSSSGTNSRVYWLFNSGALNGSIVNSGTVNMDLTSNSYTRAYFISATSDYLYGSITNSGSLSASVIADGDIYIYGFDVDELEDSSITHSGQMTFTADSGDYVYLYGIKTDAIANGNIISSGSIDLFAQADSSAYLYGLNLADTVDSDSAVVVNDITVSANVSEDGNYATSYAIKIDTLDGDLVVNGDVSANASGPIASAYAVRIDDGNGTFTNNGSLSGEIEVDADVDFINNGTITLASDQDAYTDGTYSQGANGVINLGLGTMQSASLWSATTATFASGSVINFNFDSDVSIGDNFDNVIEAVTSLDVSGATFTDNSYLLDALTTLDGDTIDISVTQGNSFSDALSGSGNALQGAGKFWDDIFTNGTSDADLNTILDNLKTYSSGEEIASAIASTLPNGAQATGETANNVSGTIGNVVSGRQSNSRGGSGVSTGDEMLAERNFWVKPFYSQAQQDNSNGAYGYKADTYGTAIGFDTDLSSEHRIGAALFFSQSDIDVNDVSQSSDVTSYNAMIYGSLPVIDENTYLDWQAGLGLHNNSSARYVTLNSSTASADYDSYSAQLSGTLSREYAINAKTTLTPHIKGSYQYQSTESYAESGAGALNLNVESSNSDRLLVGMGAQIERQISPKLVLTANAGLNYDLLGGSDAITSSYAGDSTVSFSTEGVKTDELSVEGGFGLNYQKSENFNVEIAYDFEASSGFDNQSVSAKLKWRF